MLIEDIEVDFKEKLDLLNKYKYISYDLDTQRLCFECTSGRYLSEAEFKEILSLYKMYYRLWKNGGCESCRQQKMGWVLTKYDLLLRKLHTKYFGG